MPSTETRRSEPLQEPLKALLGGNTAQAMSEHLGLRTVGDLLHHYPPAGTPSAAS